MFKCGLLGLVFVLGLTLSGCVLVPVKTVGFLPEQQVEYFSCIASGGIFVGGKCFSSPQEASSYWRTKAMLHRQEVWCKQQAERNRGEARAVRDHKAGK